MPSTTLTGPLYPVPWPIGKYGHSDREPAFDKTLPIHYNIRRGIPSVLRPRVLEVYTGCQIT